MGLALRSLLALWVCSSSPAASAVNGMVPRSALLEAMTTLHSVRGGAIWSARISRFFDAAPARVSLLMHPFPARSWAPLDPLARRLDKPDPERPLVVPVPTMPPPPPFLRTFQRLSQQPQSTNRYDDIILRWARRYSLDPRLLKAIIAAESEFFRRAVSPAGARGLMQLMPDTAEEMGVSRHILFDPEHNIRAGAAYLAHLFARTARVFKLRRPDGASAPLWAVQRVVAAYNGGPRMLLKSACPGQVRVYVSKVLLFYGSDVAGLPARPAP